MTKMNEYRLRAVAESGCLFRPNGNLVVEIDSSYGPVRITYGTLKMEVNGFSKPIPNGVFAEVVGQAPNLDIAADHFLALADNVSVFLSLATNCGIKPFEWAYCIETSNPDDEQEYFVNKHKIEQVLPFGRRNVPREQVAELLMCFLNHPEQKRLRRAIANYHEMLIRCAPGQEMMSLAHIYIGIETLTVVARRGEFVKNNVKTNQELADLWGVDIKKLDSEIRLRILFEGDEDTFKKAREASDGFEHGFKELDDIKAIAVDKAEISASYLRKAILRYLGASEATLKILLEKPYNIPFITKYHRACFGKLRAKKINLKEVDISKMFNWTEVVKEKKEIETEDYAGLTSENSLSTKMNGVELLSMEHKLKNYNK